VALAALALVMAACSKSSTPVPVVHGTLGFDETTAVQTDTLGSGTFPTANSFFSCGTSTATFATEILTNPLHAKVRFEWGDVVPGLQAFASGSVTDLSIGHGGDLPFTHPFGDDMTFDMKLDSPYTSLSQTVGSAPNDIPAGTLHTEVPEGLIPHGTDGSFQPGFTPTEGDQSAAYGPWIVDCGHPDFHTEIHPPTVIAFGHQEGSATVTHAFYNPYTVTQLFTPFAKDAADFPNTSRLTDPNTLPFPTTAFKLLLRIGHLGPPGPLCCANRLVTHPVIAPNETAPPSWFVCAPGPKPAGGSLSVSSSFTTRSGVKVTVTPNDDIGCAEVSATMGSSYTPQPLQRKSCVLPWSVLSKQAADALGVPGLDIRAAIDTLVPKSFVPAVNRNPVVDCYDPLVAPPLGTSGVTVSDSQPYPFYGTVSVSWKS